MPATIHTESLSTGFSFDLILVEGGAFDMGGQDEEAFDDEKPVHQVQVPAFFLGQFPVTQALWKAVMGEKNNPSRFKGDRRPVETVSWQESQEFIQKLNERTAENRQALGLGAYRLPTEAEWEYAARGGAHSEGYLYAGSDKLKEVGWYNENSNNQTQEVGLLLANELGFFDMSGNVWEWVEDHWHGSYEGAPADGTAWLSDGAPRVRRGGSAFNGLKNCLVASRPLSSPDNRSDRIGFRLALTQFIPGQFV